MIILSLDASTKAVGWAFSRDDHLMLSSVFVPDPDLPWWARIRSVGVWIQEDSIPDVLAYEIATGRHGNLHTDRVLGALEYEVRLSAIRIGAEFIGVTASQVKASGVHKDALELARQLKGAPLHAKYPTDEADAIGVSIAAWGMVKKRRMEAQR